ncbi:Meckel syndrome type 1 protein homolog [Anopheles stephensi]|uniref:Meckel syndrome type 1 protein homolog n=1 Tax=Anopheles stephensi TaxID=30069 RepID=UPI001658AB3F|nr:Meckel syndrome type 1 protein homolog [Anopheles stephensi]XP_035912691.1 Meckel syndrome type 1 protein homolog [Anopheles stephensi]
MNISRADTAINSKSTAMFSIQKQYKTGVYRTSGPISNFRCRLTIRKIHSLIDVPILEGLDKSLEDRETAENGTNETRTIGWQEKIFSHYERDYYRIKENCKTDHHKKYYHMLKTDSHAPQLLFTYVDEDNYYPDDRDNRNRRQQPEVSPSKTQSMYLMADLGHEVLLFSINWCPDEGLLTVYPDFNHMTTNPFYHEMRESNLHMYHYALERCFAAKAFLPKPVNQLALIGTNKPGSQTQTALDRNERFVMPKQLHRNLLLLMEIVAASDFEYDGIHIRYRVELPADVKMVNKDSQLAGSTQASKQLNNRWHFAHCHELLLRLPDAKQTPRCLEVYFEAISIDDWCRERYLGHSHLSIPLRYQLSETTVNFVQLTNLGAMADRMELFLVGNRRQVDLPVFYGKAGSTILNRYANETGSSGKLQIRFQMIRQHQPKIINDGYFKSTRKTKNITLNELIRSYSTARERLEEFVDLNY